MRRVRRNSARAGRTDGGTDGWTAARELHGAKLTGYKSTSARKQNPANSPAYVVHECISHCRLLLLLLVLLPPRRCWPRGRRTSPRGERISIGILRQQMQGRSATEQARIGMRTGHRVRGVSFRGQARSVFVPRSLIAPHGTAPLGHYKPRISFAHTEADANKQAAVAAECKLTACAAISWNCRKYSDACT
jgi:hypothetical protein